MGTWGTAVFSDDTASDVRDEFKDHIGDGMTAEDATTELVKTYADSIDDMDDGPPFWLGLAATQWALGRLLPEVRDRAIQIIESGEDLRRWEEDPKLLAKREKVLAALRLKLNSPPPPPKKVPRRFRNSCDWPVGAIVSYRGLDGRLWWFRVVGHRSDGGETVPQVEVLDWSREDPPPKWRTRWLKVRVGRDGLRQIMIYALSKREVPSDRLRLTGMISTPSPLIEVGSFFTLWRNLDLNLASTFISETTPD